jgi:hypothetical protein
MTFKLAGWFYSKVLCFRVEWVLEKDSILFPYVPSSTTEQPEMKSFWLILPYLGPFASRTLSCQCKRLVPPFQ